MRALLAFIICGLMAVSALGQTTNTNCTTIGNQTNCTSTTQPDNSESQKEAYQTGQALGAGLGAMIARYNQIKNYCKFHPGESWHTADYSRAGTCKAPKGGSRHSAPDVSASHFVFNSPEANEWCSHQPKGTSYTASDGAGHYCAEKPLGQLWVFDGISVPVLVAGTQTGINCHYLSKDGSMRTWVVPGPRCPPSFEVPEQGK